MDGKGAIDSSPHTVDVLTIGRERALRMQRRTRVLIVTAVDVEMTAALKQMSAPEDSPKILHCYIDTEAYYIGRIGRENVVTTRIEPGSVGRGASSLAIDTAIRIWQPRAVILVGIAFGVRPAVQSLGDVMVADRVIHYDRERVGAEVVARGVNAETGQILLHRFRDLAPRWMETHGGTPKVHFGSVLSGEKLIANADYKSELVARYPTAIGGEMEGAGLYSAAARAGVEWIVVKGICDWGDEAKHDSMQAAAAENAISLVKFVIDYPTAFSDLLGPSSDGFLQGTDTVDVTIKINRPISSMDFRAQEEFLTLLSDACKLTGRVLVVRKEEGSVLLTVRITYEDAARLFVARDAGTLQALAVVELLDPRPSEVALVPPTPPIESGQSGSSTSGSSTSCSPPSVRSKDRSNDGTLVNPGGKVIRAKTARELIPEKIYDVLLGARTADKVTVYFKDGRIAHGALIFNPFKGTGRLINIDQEVSIDFAVKDIRDLKF
jgi:nucleoside phosphorylase